MKRMTDSGVIDFDEMKSRIKNMDDKRKEVTGKNEPVQIQKERTSTEKEQTESTAQTETPGEIVDTVNEALSQVQSNVYESLEDATETQKLQRTNTKANKEDNNKLRRRLDDLEQAFNHLEAQPSSEPTQTQSASQTKQAPKKKPAKKVKNKNNKYSSDDVALNKIFKTER